MKKDILLCLVNGPWQALSLVATLEQRKHDRPDRVVMLLVDMVAGSSFYDATRRVLSANGFLEQHTLDRNTSLRALPGALRGLCRVSGLDLTQVSMVASFGMHRPVARYLLNILPSARVLIYEEGLRAYVPPSTSLREHARMKLAAAWGRVDTDFGKGWTPPRAWSEMEYALLLADRLPLPAETYRAVVHHVEVEPLRAAMAALPTPKLRELPAQPYVLIVGQYYARLEQLSAEVELGAYLTAARAIAARGHVPVWRGHLREQDELFVALKRGCPSLRDFSELVEDPSMPLELYRGLFTERCLATVSFSSSALFYLSHVYGTKAYTLLTDAMVSRMRDPHRAACALARAHVPSFSRSSYALEAGLSVHQGCVRAAL